MRLRHSSLLILVALLLLLGSTAACTAQPPPQPKPPPQPELTLYNWAEYMPQAVLDQFEAETGLHVNYVTYESQDEAAAAIRAGGVAFDVAVVAYDWAPGLYEAGLLAKIDRNNVPNFKNIGPQFRNLFYDPENTYTVPYLWGTTGLLVRTDLVAEPVTHWADLWERQWPGKILARPIVSELFGAALLAQGDSLNSEDPAELAAALARLQQIKPALLFAPVETGDALRPLLEGEAVVMIGWNGDALAAQEENGDITYVMPAEGAIAWVDNFVISAHSRNQDGAEAFINFVLRPDVSAAISEAYSYPSANDAANQYVDAALLANPLIFPAAQDLGRLTFYLPHSLETTELYKQLWQQFQEAE